MAIEWDFVPQHLLDLRRYFWDVDSVCRVCGARIDDEDFYVHGRECPRCRGYHQTPSTPVEGGEMNEGATQPATS